MKGLETWAQLVEKIEALRLDCFDMGKAGFTIVMDQLRILNPGLNTKGVILRSRIIEGELIHGSLEEEEEEEE